MTMRTAGDACNDCNELCGDRGSGSAPSPAQWAAFRTEEKVSVVGWGKLRHKATATQHGPLGDKGSGLVYDSTHGP